MRKFKSLCLGVFLALFLVGMALAGMNLNTATAEELAKLPCVGSKIAQAIVEYRRAHGPFKSVEELLNVKGIGPKRLEKIRPLISVEEN